MPETGLQSISCRGCGMPRTGDDVEQVENGERIPCLECGNEHIIFHVSFHDKVTTHERLDLKVKQGGKGKPTVEQRQGDDFHHESGEWRKIIRLVDRGNDRYVEKVVGPDGSVIRSVDQPLSEYRGHGSDTTRPKAEP